MTNSTPPPSELAKALGGTKGIVDSALAPTAFVVVRLVTHSQSAAIASALGVGVLILGIRLARKEAPHQAIGGFFALALAAAVSSFTGTGKGFFLPGIITTALSGVGALVSLLVGKPFVGLALAAYDARYANWQTNPALLRACRISTAVWTATLFLRAGVATVVYNIKGDHAGLMLVVINAVKIPAIALAVIVTWVMVKNATPKVEHAAE